jgi:hypothetical protein
MSMLREYIQEVLNERLELVKYGTYCELVADAYDEAPDHDPEAVASYRTLIGHINKMYERMQSKVKVEYVGGQPYATAAEMAHDVQQTKKLKISTDFNDSPVFNKTENLKFRAVHDYVVHVQTGKDFSDKGEVAAFNAHAKMVPPAAIPALFTEVVGQACYYNARGHFPPQKIAILKGFDYHHVGKVQGWLIRNKRLVKQ